MAQTARDFKSLARLRPGSKRGLGRYAPMTKPTATPHDPAYNRDEEQQPDAARMAQEPAGSEGSARSPKTATDPASGATPGPGSAPNQAQADQSDGAPTKDH